MMIVRTMGTVLATAALCLGGAVAVAGTAHAAGGTRCQGDQLESVPIKDGEGHVVGRTQRFRELGNGNCAETYTNLGDGASISTFVIVDGRVQVVHGGSVGVRWPAQKGCAIMGGVVNGHKGQAKACG